jgi:adenylosuccinate synthase
VYDELEGWLDDISSSKKYEDLPKNAKLYIDKIRKLVGIPISIVSVGPKRSQTIELEPLF